MAGVCSWCGAPLNDEVGKIEFLCEVCNVSAENDECSREKTAQEWKPWMPAGPYPKLDRGDSRRA